MKTGLTLLTAVVLVVAGYMAYELVFRINERVHHITHTLKEASR